MSEDQSRPPAGEPREVFDQVHNRWVPAKDSETDLDAVMRSRAEHTVGVTAKDNRKAVGATSVQQPSQAAIVIASLWAVVAVIGAIVLFVNAQDAAYGGDAYTDIQNAVMLAVRGIAGLLIGSAALGLIIATRSSR